MKRWAAAMAVALAACAPGAETPTVEGGCQAAAAAVWSAEGVGDLAVEAAAEGQTCADAEARISIRDAAGREIWNETHNAAQLMTLAGAAGAVDMRTRLGEWIDASRNVSSTAQLPEWLADEDTPMSGEFPFYPDEGVDRDAYEAVRARALPMFCYVQGMESQACLYLENGTIRRLGAQSFPG